MIVDLYYPDRVARAHIYKRLRDSSCNLMEEYVDDFEPFFTRRQGRDMLRPGLLPDAKRGRVR